MVTASPGLHRIAWVLLLAGLTLYMALSSLTLAHMGVPYDRPGGNPLLKIHFGTYLLLAGLACALAARGHPLAQLGQRLRHQPWVATYLACMVSAGLWGVMRHGTSGAAFFVDTLWMPGVALLLLAHFSARRHRVVLCWVIGLLAINAVVALGEYSVKKALVPRYPIESDLIPDANFFRSSGLLGHPLANALITVTLLPAALLLPVRAFWRWALVLLLVLALLAFGSRAALAATGSLYLGGLVLAVAWRAIHGEYSYLQLTGGLLAAFAVVTGAVGLVLALGLGERIFANLTWDQSAQVRVVAWQALEYMDSETWWFGASPARIDEIATRIGLDLRYEAIENFWIVLLMQLGLVGFVPFLLGIAAGMWHLWQVSPGPMRLAIPVYFLVSSGANTLAAKSVSLILLMVVAAAAAAMLQPRAAVAAPGGGQTGHSGHSGHLGRSGHSGRRGGMGRTGGMGRLGRAGPRGWQGAGA